MDNITETQEYFINGHIHPNAVTAGTRASTPSHYFLFIALQYDISTVLLLLLVQEVDTVLARECI